MEHPKWLIETATTFCGCFPLRSTTTKWKAGANFSKALSGHHHDYHHLYPVSVSQSSQSTHK